MRELTSVDELREVIAGSSDAPVFLFKHSTTCPISARASMRLKEFLAEDDDDTPECYLVHVIESRLVSNAITKELGVAHASPQLVLVGDGKAVWDTSHGSIRAENIEAALGEFLGG